MKTKVIILLISLLVVTGCSVIRMDTMNIDNLIDTVVKEGNVTQSVNYRGYSYYLPSGINRRNSNEYNEILYSKNNVYYFYVDIVSYFNKVEYLYEVNESAYYSKAIEYDNKYGYIEINEEENGYFVEMMYNYSKIEVLAKESDLEDVITNGILILNSINYNDVIIDSLIGEKSIILDAEEFTILKPDNAETNFLDYEREDNGSEINGNYDDDMFYDEDVIDTIE